MGTKRLNILRQSRREEYGEAWVTSIGKKNTSLSFQISQVGHLYLFKFLKEDCGGESRI